MKSISHSILFVLLLAGNNQNQATGFSDPVDDGYFRFLSTGGDDDDNNNDPNDDKFRDEDFSFIPPFIPHFHTLGYPKISTDPYVHRDYFDSTFNIVIKHKEDLKREIYDINNDDEDEQPPECIVIESNSGAQLWGMLAISRGIFTGLFPHYFGKSRVKICILNNSRTSLWDPETQKVSGRTPFGTVRCTYDPRGDALEFLKTNKESVTVRGVAVTDAAIALPGKGFVFLGKAFTIPDTMEVCGILHFHCHNLGFATSSTSDPPYTAVAQLTGFADQEVFCYDSYEEFDVWSKANIEITSQISKFRKELKEEDTRFYSEFFGTDTKKFEDMDQHALIFGHVIETEIKTNEHTGEKFVWALIQTCQGMEIDVVFRQSLLESLGSPLPKVGGIVRGHFWLSGVLMLDGANEYI